MVYVRHPYIAVQPIIPDLNIDEAEYASPLAAKTCGSMNNTRKVAYSFLSESHALCIDKKDLMLAQLDACEKLLKYATDPSDKTAIEKEIKELRMALDLLT
jgi:hypothetical protein